MLAQKTSRTQFIWLVSGEAGTEHKPYLICMFRLGIVVHALVRLRLMHDHWENRKKQEGSCVRTCADMYILSDGDWTKPEEARITVSCYHVLTRNLLLDGD